MDAAALVKKYIEVRQAIDDKETEFEKELAPYKSCLKTLETAMNTLLLSLNTESVKTDAGTAYVSNIMSTKVSNRQALMEYVARTGNFNLLTAAVSKEQVKEFMEANDGHVPPGVDVASIRKVNFRRS